MFTLAERPDLPDGAGEGVQGADGQRWGAEILRPMRCSTT